METIFSMLANHPMETVGAAIVALATVAGLGTVAGRLRG